MTINSLTSLAAGAVRQSLTTQNSRLAASIAHLASGNRIARASEDVASLSMATSLQTQTTSLRSAALNISQASSMLQVADGGLNQIGSMLERMQALSVQANSGALSDSARTGLNSEFQALAQEIDRIAGNTNFNGVNLLDGSLSVGGSTSGAVDTGTQAQGSLTFAGGIAAGQTVNLNGVTLTAGTDFNVAGTTQQTVQNLADSLNNDARFDGFTFSANGGALNITADDAGEAGNQFTIDQAASTATFAVGGDSLTGAGVFSLSGGRNGDLNGATVSGNVNDRLVTSQSQTAASSTITFNSASDIQAGDTIQIDDGEGGFTTFTFVNGTPASSNQIQIGSTLQGTLQNAADTLEDFSGAGDFGTRQLDFSVSGNSLVIRGETSGNPTDVAGAALDINLGTTGGSISNTSLNNGTNSGVDVSNVTNAAFSGRISGFEATYRGNDSVDVSIRVGNETYTARISDTTPGSDTRVRFTSENGGSFDVTLAGGQGIAVSNQNQAETFEARLDAAFSGLEFEQPESATSASGNGGATFQISDSSDGTISIDLGNATTASLFSGVSLSLMSSDGAQAAFAAVGSALDNIISQRSDVGSFQSALGYASANIESAIQNQEAARSTLEDTDFATESTLNAQARLQQQVSLATLAQTNRLSSNMLQLLVS